MAMNEKRTLCGGAVSDRKFYVLGGYDGANYLSTMEAFDPDSGRWTNQPPMPASKSSAAVASIGTSIFAVGGYNGREHTASGYVYEDSQRSWSVLAPMGIARTGSRSAVVDGTLYVIGGWHGTDRTETEEHVKFPQDEATGRSYYHASYSTFDLDGLVWANHAMESRSSDPLVS